MRKFLIDTDTASDDAVALLMALRHPEVEVLAVTVTSGNVPVDQGVLNALYTVELARVPCPVFRGADRPLRREPIYAHFFHGPDGLGGRGYRPARAHPEKTHAVDALIESVRKHPGLTVVTLGPLTNLALAVQRAPEIVPLVGRCVVMGGAACTVGNVTPAAEYNIWVDPDAARIVFLSGLPLEMAGWELCRGEANLSVEEMALVRSFANPLADFALDCNETAIAANHRQSGDPGLALPDPVAMAIALDPSVCTRRSRCRVLIETESELTRGMTVIDALDVTQDERNRAVWKDLPEPNAEICWEIDVARWKSALYRTLRAG